MRLFEGIAYFLSSSLPPHRKQQLEYALDRNGAVRPATLDEASHIITNSAHFEGRDHVRQGVAVVSDIWVDRSLVLGKPQPPQYYSVDPAMIFSGIVACATELPTHDLEVLFAGITALGGQWRTGLSNDVTHLFAISPNSSKYSTALAHRHSTGIRVLLPHWFDDSVRLGVRNLTLEPYLWPDPPLLRGPLAPAHLSRDPIKENQQEKEEGQSKKAMMATASMFTAASNQLSFPQHTYQLPLSKQDVWSGKKILLSWTLSLYGSRREAVEVGIKRAGGEVVRYAGDDQEDDMESEEKERRRDRKEARAISECDILITRWRNGKAYVAAFRAGKTIGTLAWLYHVQSTGLTPRPVDQLLHYPIPRRPVEGFTAHEITVTNYTGEAREYIKRMITAMGADFTPSMSGRNTVLIAAFLKGTKAEKARAWSIPIVNHTWLEDCFVQWRNLTVGIEKYIVFPPGVDFSKMIGERGVGVRGVELCEEEEGQEADETSDESVQDKNAVEGGKGVAEMEIDANVLITNSEEQDIETTVPKLQPLTSKVQISPKVAAVREVSAILSPAKTRQKSSVITNASPRLANGKKLSPTKKATTRRGKEEINVMEVDTVEEDGKGIAAKELDQDASDTAIAIDMDIDKDDEMRPARIPASRSKGKQKEVVLQLSDESDDELSKTPPFYSSSAAVRRSNAPERSKEKAPEGRKREKRSKKYNSDSEREHDQSRNTDGEKRSPALKRKKVYERNESSDEEPTISPTRKSSSKKASPKKKVSRRSDEIDRESDVEVVAQNPPQKRKLVRRATSDASLRVSMDQEKQDIADAPRKLVRRASTKVIDRENPDKEKEKEKDDGDEKHDKENISAQSTSILRTTRGDARTRVKAKGAKAKARELLSESEDEVFESANKRRAVVKARGKKGNPSKKQTKGTGKALPSDDDDKETEGEEEQKGIPSPKSSIATSTPVRKVSVVVDHPSSVKKLRSSVSLRKVKMPLKSKTASDTDNNNNEGEEGEEDLDDSEGPEMTRRARPKNKVAKTESIHVEAGQTPVSSKLKVKPKTKASPLTAIQTPHSDIPEEPPTSGHPRRGAATKAEQRLKVMMPDATKFEQEMRKSKKSGRSSLHGIDVGGWEGESKEASIGSKRKKQNSERAESEESEHEQIEKREAKKRRLSTAREKAQQKGGDDHEERRGKKIEKKARDDSDGEESEEAMSGATTKGKGKGKLYLMTTQANLPDNVIKTLDKLGVSMTTKPSQCTHLVAPHVVRTEKLLCALAVAPHILEASWAIKSAAAKQLLPVDRFRLKDENAEKKYDFKLSEMLERARKLKGRLLAGKTFYVTPKIPVDYKLLRSVASAHGGQVIQQTPTVRLIQANPNRYVISCPEDISIWRPLAAQEIPVYTHEFLLTGVLKQELEWDNPAFRVLKA